MTAVIPRRRRASPVTRPSMSGVEPSPSTAARSCMILRCWRPPRSAGRTDVRWPVAVRPTARFSVSAGRRSRPPPGSRPRPWLVAAPGLDPPVEVEEDPGVGGLLEVELLDLDLAVAGGRLPVDPVEAVARGLRPDGRRERASSEASAPGRRGCPRRWPPAGATAEAGRPAGRRSAVTALADRRRRLEEPERVAGPDLERLDPEVAAPGQRHPDEPRSARRASRARSPGRAGHRAAWSGCGPRATAWAPGRCCGGCT